MSLKEREDSSSTSKETPSLQEDPNFQDLSQFSVSRLLGDNGQKKTICVLGSFKDSNEKGIILLEKQPFNEDIVKQLCSEKSILEKVFQNDIYGNYTCFPDVKLNGIKTTIIYPATDQHVDKFETKPIYLVDETPELYNSVTLPFILKEQFSLQWVYNILEHKKEVERIVYEDPDKDIGFVLLPDLKWNGELKETLYLLAIVQKHGIKSLRDLTSEHLPLLRNVLTKGSKAIFEKYGVPVNQLRIYLHYQPSFYHLHIHFCYLNFEAPGIFAEKCHLLSTVINNIELLSDFYQKANLPFIVKEGYGLFTPYEKQELRPKLQACQFYIITELPAEAFQLKILKHKILLSSEQCGVEIHLENVNLKPETLSGLKVLVNSLQFRVQTDPLTTWGSFKTEVLQLEKVEKSEQSYRPEIEVNKPLYIFCNFCCNQLSEKPFNFNRVLPLPSSNLEAADFFCHETQTDTQLQLKPKEMDCLYGLYFVKISASFLKEKEKVLHCDRCFSWLGTCEKASVYLWNSTVVFRTEKPSEVQKVALSDFIGLVRETIAGSVGVSCKILMQCEVSENQKHYLLLWVMDKNLQLLVKRGENTPVMKLCENNVVKVLFKFETEPTPLVKSWEKDIYVTNTAVSKQMMIEGLKNLEEMSNYIPFEYRTANSMYLSYVGILNE